MNKIIFIVGPTASGKTNVAIQLADKLKSEIVSCDAMQIYHEINIASSKPSKSELKINPHHLVNIISVSDEFDVVAFNRLATKAIEEIISRGKIPIVVGGSGLYMQILLDGIFEAGPKDMKLRDKLTAEAAEKGNQFLYERLKSLDERVAEKIHPHDLKRLIRALEVCLTEKEKFSILRKNRQGLWGKYDVAIFGLIYDRPLLYDRINERVETMMKYGLVDEIRALDKMKLGRTAQTLIGVREIRDFLKGHCSLEEAKEKIKMNTRRYAKRQMTWFRKEKRINWIHRQENDDIKKIIREILERANIDS